MVLKSIQRLGWRFSEATKATNNNFRINTKDIEALKHIDKYIAEKEKQQFHNYELFAKLFIFTYKRMFEIEGGNIFDNGMTAKRRKIYGLLSKTTSQLVQDFTDMLNDSEQYELLESIQGYLKHPALLSDEQRGSNLKKLQDAYKEPENQIKLTKEVWDYHFVKECLEAEVNQAINFFNSSKKR